MFLLGLPISMVLNYDKGEWKRERATVKPQGFFSFIFIVDSIIDVPISPPLPASTQPLPLCSLCLFFPLDITKQLSVSMGYTYMFFG